LISIDRVLKQNQWRTTAQSQCCVLVMWYLLGYVKQRKQMRTIVLLSIRLYLRTEQDLILSISCLREQPLRHVCLLLKSPLSLN